MQCRSCFDWTQQPFHLMQHVIVALHLQRQIITAFWDVCSEDMRGSGTCLCSKACILEKHAHAASRQNQKYIMNQSSSEHSAWTVDLYFSWYRHCLTWRHGDPSLDSWLLSETLQEIDADRIQTGTNNETCVGCSLWDRICLNIKQLQDALV